jgi:hypothetical protein
MRRPREHQTGGRREEIGGIHKHATQNTPYTSNIDKTEQSKHNNNITTTKEPIRGRKQEI